MRDLPLTGLAALLSLTLGLPAQVAVNDVFDRAGGTQLGPDWSEIDGDAVINMNRLEGNSPFTFGWSAHTVFAAPYASTVVRADWSMNGGGGDRISLIAGVDPVTWQGIEVRIADNDGNGTADRVFFNAAVNAGNWYGGSTFAILTNQIVAGRATLWFSNGGDTANLEIFDPATGGVEVVSAGGILQNPPTGTAVGLGYFGNGWADDFRAFTGSSTTPCYTLTPPRVGFPASFLLTEATPSSAVILAFSTVGAGPLPTPIGTVALSLPIEILSQSLPTDASGRLEIALPPLPGFLLGTTLHNQAVDVSSMTLSNGFTVTVQ